MAYAETTNVAVTKSKAEIEELLVRHGCNAIATIWEATEGIAAVQFRYPLPGEGESAFRMVRFQIGLPSVEDRKFHFTPARGERRSPNAARRAYEQATRSRWRALLLCIRAKLEAVETGIETFEEAFMAQILLPDNSTVGQRLLPKVAEAYETGEMPRLTRLLGPGQ